MMHGIHDYNETNANFVGDDDEDFICLSLKKGVTLLAVGVLRVLTPPCMSCLGK